MTNEELTDILGGFSQTLSGIAGRLIVASMHDPVIKEAHSMSLELGCMVDDLINDLLCCEE